MPNHPRASHPESQSSCAGNVEAPRYIAHLWERAKFLGMWDEAHDHNLAEQQVEMDFTEVRASEVLWSGCSADRKF